MLLSDISVLFTHETPIDLSMKQGLKAPIKASIVILDFQKSKRVCENVASIHEQVTDFEYEIIIVDNSCNEKNAKKLNTLRDFSDVQIITNTKNVGYIRGSIRKR